jgi:thiamine-phosphate pyrophosphorylase
MACKVRPNPGVRLISAACHSVEQLVHAEQIGVDFVTLSPVLLTMSHPDARPLGWDTFSKLAASVSIPIYALGGMSREHLGVAQSKGAYGIAGISGFW